MLQTGGNVNRRHRVNKRLQEIARTGGPGGPRSSPACPPLRGWIRARALPGLEELGSSAVGGSPALCPAGIAPRAQASGKLTRTAVPGASHLQPGCDAPSAAPAGGEELA